MNYLLSVLVENKPGVLSRVTGLISRRGFNIESLTVAPTEDEHLPRMTIIVRGDERLRADHQAAAQARLGLQDLRPHLRGGRRARARALQGARRARAPQRDHRDRQHLPREDRRRGQKLAHHRGHRRRREASWPGRPAARLRHQGNRPHRQSSPLPQLARLGNRKGNKRKESHSWPSPSTTSRTATPISSRTRRSPSSATAPRAMRMR